MSTLDILRDLDAPTVATLVAVAALAPLLDRPTPAALADAR